MSKSKNSRASKEDLQVNRARDRRPSIESGHACMHAAAAQAAVALVSSNHGRNTEEEDDGDSMLKRGSASSWVGTGALDRDSPTNSSPAMERGVGDGLEAGSRRRSRSDEGVDSRMGSTDIGVGVSESSSTPPIHEKRLDPAVETTAVQQIGRGGDAPIGMRRGSNTVLGMAREQRNSKELLGASSSSTPPNLRKDGSPGADSSRFGDDSSRQDEEQAAREQAANDRGRRSSVTDESGGIMGALFGRRRRSSIGLDNKVNEMKPRDKSRSLTEAGITSSGGFEDDPKKPPNQRPKKRFSMREALGARRGSQSDISQPNGERRGSSTGLVTSLVRRGSMDKGDPRGDPGGLEEAVRREGERSRNEVRNEVSRAVNKLERHSDEHFATLAKQLQDMERILRDIRIGTGSAGTGFMMLGGGEAS